MQTMAEPPLMGGWGTPPIPFLQHLLVLLENLNQPTGHIHVHQMFLAAAWYSLPLPPASTLVGSSPGDPAWALTALILGFHGQLRPLWALVCPIPSPATGSYTGSHLPRV